MAATRGWPRSGRLRDWNRRECVCQHGVAFFVWSQRRAWPTSWSALACATSQVQRDCSGMERPSSCCCCLSRGRGSSCRSVTFVNRRRGSTHSQHWNHCSHRRWQDHYHRAYIVPHGQDHAPGAMLADVYRYLFRRCCSLLLSRAFPNASTRRYFVDVALAHDGTTAV